MKNIKFIFLVMISSMFIFPLLTNAEAIKNYNGIVISAEEYSNFLKIYDHEYIMHMTEEKYNKLKELDFSNLTTEIKYIETMYNPNLKLTTEKEITKEQYDNYTFNSNGVSPLLDNGGASHETQAKKINISIIGGTTWNYVTVTATWKGIPSVRSFDVIGIRGYGFEFGEGTQSGEQIYILDGNYTVIDYSWNGTNIKKFNDGFGISMNIVNSDITFLQLITECDVKATITHPSIFGSYQHAQQTLSLEDSQNYTLGLAGLGDVFVFPYSISQKYDGMSGVSVNY